MQSQSWKVESLRLTSFVNGLPDTERKWWSELQGDEPTARNFTPRTRLLHEEGLAGPGKLTIEVQPMRMDLVLSAGPEAPQDLPLLQSVGSIGDTIAWFGETAGRFLELFLDSPALRIAFGAVLFSEVESRERGYERLSGMLPFSLDQNGSSDFFYQINRPRTIIIHERSIGINRLSKWSVAQLSGIFVQAIPEMAAVSLPVSSFAIRIELDVNTVPAQQLSLDKAQSAEVLKTLVGFAAEIAETGDKP